MRFPFRSWCAFAAVAAASGFAAAARAAGDGPAALAEAGRRLAALPGLRATVVARDELAGRTFRATLTYRAPDRLRVVIGGDDFIHLAGGTITAREAGVTRRTDVSAWAHAAAERLAPSFAEAAALLSFDGPPARLDLVAERLAPVFALDFQRGPDEVTTALLVAHRFAFDDAAAGAPGLAFSFRGEEGEPPSIVDLDAEGIRLRAGAREARISRATGLPERVVLRGQTGRIEAEVAISDVEILEAVPDDLLAPPGLPSAAPVPSEPTPRTKDGFAREALAALLGRVRAAAARDPALVSREAAKLEAILARCYGAILRAKHAEARLRELACEAARADEATVLEALEKAGPAGRERALDDLRARFHANCSQQLRHAGAEIVGLAEAAIGPPTAGAPDAVECARHALVSISGRAALAAYREAIVGPMEDAASAELERLAASGSRPAGGTP